jgi:translation initiation factor 2 subunit 2
MFWFILLQQLAPFDPSKKKKKKKVVIQEPVEDLAESSQTEKSDSLPGMYDEESM